MVGYHHAANLNYAEDFEVHTYNTETSSETACYPLDTSVDYLGYGGTADCFDAYANKIKIKKPKDNPPSPNGVKMAFTALRVYTTSSNCGAISSFDWASIVA